MAVLADRIEQYIKELLETSEGTIRIRRNQLAEKFMCVPSQINYVLNTRFNLEQGYIVESRRGGGGYLKIIKLPLDSGREIMDLLSRTPDVVSHAAAKRVLRRLYEEDFLTKREMLLMNSIIRREVISLELPDRDILRANILKAMIGTMLRDEFSR